MEISKILNLQYAFFLLISCRNVTNVRRDYQMNKNTTVGHVVKGFVMTVRKGKDLFQSEAGRVLSESVMTVINPI